MKSIIKIVLLGLLIAFVSTLVATSYAQEGGPNSRVYLDRAQQAANGGAPVQPPPGISPEDFARFQQGNRVLSGDTTPLAPPPVKMITVIEGEKVISAKSGIVLQLPERKEVPETLKDNYFDDGTHGDEVAGDKIYSNVIVRKNVISKDEFKQRLTLETLINKISKDSPVEFYRLYVASDGHNPEIPSYAYWKTRRDEFVTDYKTRVLSPYKDENGNFYEVYEPPVAANAQGGAQIAGRMPGQQGGPQNVGLATSVQGRVNNAARPGDDTGINQVGGSSYFGEQNKFK